MYHNARRPDAIARVFGGPEAPELAGQVRFFREPDGVLVVADLVGLPSPSSFFALHIHEGMSCAGVGFEQTGSHFNPDAAPHPDHAGDLPPLLSSGGKAYLAVRTNRLGLPDILGRTVVIHSGPDDFRTQPAGNAGTKIACGVIREVSSK